MVVSSSLLLEYEAVLLRKEQVAVHGLTTKAIQKFLVALTRVAIKARIAYRYRPQLRDPDDEMVLEAAINGHAAAVVTHNVRDFLPAARHFGIQVLTPASILKGGLQQ